MYQIDSYALDLLASSLGWGKGFGEEFAGMYRKKRNKRSDAHDVMEGKHLNQLSML
jgi:hypothetical protein